MSELIDIHSHLYLPTYLDLLRARRSYPRVATVDGEDRFIIFPEEDRPGQATGRPIADDFWSVDAKLAYMDSVGIDRTVLSIGNPWLDPFDGPESASHAQLLNEELAELEPRTDGRIVALGVLPAHSPDVAADVVRDIAHAGRLKGLVTGPTICRRMLDDPALEPVWAALHETRLPWMLHPSDGAALDLMEGYGHSLPIGLGFPFETTISITRLVFGGVLSRFPGIQLVASHGAGTLPYLAGRLDAAWRSDPAAKVNLEVEPSKLLANLHSDAIVYHARSLPVVLDLLSDKVSFGTDHPFSVSDATANLAALDALGRDATSVRASHAAALFSL